MVDVGQAQQLLNAERRRVQGLLQETLEAGLADREAANEPGDLTDPAERLVAEVYDDSVAAGLRERLEAIDRAEHRLARGTYGLSVRSGLPIADDRLEADPAAELTIEEAEQDR
jgi:DnaK suppressor protein